MTKNGEDVQSKVVAEVKPTTAAMFVAYNIFTMLPFKSMILSQCIWRILNDKQDLTGLTLSKGPEPVLQATFC